MIQDDASIVKPIFDEMRQNMKTRETHSVSFRKKALIRLIEGYDKMKQLFDQAVNKDLGLNEFMTNFSAHAVTKSEIKDLIDQLEEWVQPQAVKTPMALGIANCSIEYQPLGLALVISAWNYPIYTSLPQVAAAIAAGNSVILKPSQMAPHTSNALARLFREHLDSKYYRCVEGRVQIAKAISKLPFDVICFTGSTATGKSVALEAAKNLTPCLLELGGKCPVIVDQTANIQSAVLRILFGKFLNCGQTCVGVDHVYIHQKISQKFKQKLLQKLKQGYSIDQIRENGDYAKIINEHHIERLTQFLNQKHNGNVVLEGVIEKNNRFMSPFVIENPSNDSLIMTEEIFGPILPLKVYNNLEQIVKEVNQRDKPLVVYVFSSNQKNIDFVKNRTISGTFVINDTVVQLLNPHLPFGGVGASGYGRYHGHSGFQHFSNPRSICNTKQINVYPLSTRFAPYTQSNKRVMTFLLKVGGITYETLGKGFKYALFVASGVAVYMFNNSVLPKL